jgi:sister-chromatid-cohesion protein PDS5
MAQDDNAKYKGLAVHLASELFLDHSSKDVKLLVACCIADIFRVFAPEAPYLDDGHVKVINDGIYFFSGRFPCKTPGDQA